MEGEQDPGALVRVSDAGLGSRTIDEESPQPFAPVFASSDRHRGQRRFGGAAGVKVYRV